MKELEMMLLLYALTGIMDEEQLEASDYLSTETPYHFTKLISTAPPKGYTPFFINYLGRNSNKKTLETGTLDKLMAILEDAETKESLTNKGKLLKTAVEGIKEQYKGITLSRSDLAIEVELAKRMYEGFQAVFGRDIQAVAAKDEASQMSMEVFINQLRYQMPDSHYQITYYTEEDPILNFYDLNDAYKNYLEYGAWREEIDRYKKRSPEMINALNNFFSEQYVNQLEDCYACLESLYKLYMTEYTRLKVLGLDEVLEGKVLQYYGSNENVYNYHEKGPGTMAEGVARTMAFPLLGDFLVTTEEAIKERKNSVYLRFANEKTFVPFINILNLPGYTNQTNKYEKIDQLWRDEKIAPRGANISWVLYEHESTKEVLIKVLYNEKEVEFPIDSTQKPYYKWQEIKKYYIQVLQNLELDWEQNSMTLIKRHK